MSITVKPAVFTIGGVDYTAEVGTIDSVRLGPEDHGLFSLDIGLSFGSMHQGFGGFALDGKPETPAGDRTPTVYGMAFITQATRVVGDLTKCIGRKVYALREVDDNYYVVGLASLSDPNVSFIPKVDLARYITVSA